MSEKHDDREVDASGATEGVEASEADSDTHSAQASEPEPSPGVFGWIFGILLLPIVLPIVLLWKLGILQVIIFLVIVYLVVFEWELISIYTFERFLLYLGSLY